MSLLTEVPPITRTPGVCGGDACIRGRRITVWLLVEARRLGSSDEELLQDYSDLNRADLDAAWKYAAEHPIEIERSIWINRASMQDYPDGVPTAVLVRGRQLGFSDSEIRQAFDPPAPLSQSVLDTAWAEYAQAPDAVEATMSQVLPPELRRG